MLVPEGLETSGQPTVTPAVTIRDGLMNLCDGGKTRSWANLEMPPGPGGFLWSPHELRGPRTPQASNKATAPVPPPVEAAGGVVMSDVQKGDLMIDDERRGFLAPEIRYEPDLCIGHNNISIIADGW